MLDNIFAMKLEHEAALHKAAGAFLNPDDAADICSQLWVDILTNPPKEIVNLDWLLREVGKRARSHRAQRIKSSHTTFSYTEEPSNTPGEISDAQLESICLHVIPSPNLKILDMLSLFKALPQTDQEFLAAYYSPTRSMVRTPVLRQRARRLRKKLQDSLK